MIRFFAWLAAFAVSLALHVAVVYGLASLVSTQSAPARATIELSGEGVAIAAQSAEPVQQTEVAGDATSKSEDTVATVPTSDAAAPAADDNQPVSAVVSSVSVDAAVDGATSPVSTNATTSQDFAQDADTSESVAATPESAVLAAIPETEETDKQQFSTEITQDQSATATSPISEQVVAPLQPAAPEVTTAQQSAAEESTVADELPSVAAVAETTAPTVVSQSDSPSLTPPGTAAANSEILAETAEPETQTAMIVSPEKPPEPVKVDHTSAIKDYLKINDGGTCFLAMPRSIGPDGAQIDAIGNDPEAFRTWETGFKNSVGAALVLRENLVDALQCSTLELVKAFAKPDGQTLKLTIANPSVPDGSDVQAELRHVTMNWLSVLLVDDEGIISDVSGRAKRVDDYFALQVPVRLSGSGQGKNQLLIAISSAEELAFLNVQGKVKADEILPFVMGEKKSKAITTEISIAMFQVR